MMNNEQMREALRLIQMNSTDAELVHEWATKAIASEGQAQQAKSVQCVGCEGKPAPQNSPCGICGKQAQPAEPVAFEFQHEDTGLIDFVDPQQVEWGFQKNNPRWQMIGPVYRHPPAEPARTAEPVASRFRYLNRDGKPITAWAATAEYPMYQHPTLEIEPLYTHPPAEVVRTLETVALIAHHGGLAKLSESDALTLIRKLTINHHDWKMTIGETKAALAAAKEAGL